MRGDRRYSPSAQNDRAKELRDRNEPTVPSTIATELATNPFLRVHDASIRSAVGGEDPHSILTNVRERKNNFR